MTSDIINEIFSKLSANDVEISAGFNKSDPANNFFVIPGKHGPRWIVPALPKFGISVLKQWHPYDITSQMKWQALKSAYQLGQLGFIPGIEKICAAPKFSINGFGSLKLTGENLPVIYVGTPGPHRKAVVTILKNTNNSDCSVLKIPLGEKASQKILHEARILQHISKNTTITAPHLLFSHSGKGVAGQEKINGKLSGRKITQSHVKWLCQLRTQGNITLSRQREELLMQIAQVEVKQTVQRRFVQQMLKSVSCPSLLPAVLVHGDFAPWNLLWDETGNLCAIDWEDAKEEGLPLYDLLHFFIIQAYLFGAKKAFLKECLRSRWVEGYRHSLGIDQDAVRSLAIFYLADSWLKQIHEGDAKHADFSVSLLKLLMD